MEKKEMIFALDDERHIRELLEYSLTSEGFDVVLFGTAADFFAELKNGIPSLILLDIMLNDANGMDICKKLRNAPGTRRVPIIMLTAKNEEVDRILGLEMGANDYITKPFSIRELVTRIKVQLRRVEKEQERIVTEIRVRDLEIHIDKYEVYSKGKPVELTPKEFELLLLLAKNVGKVLTREFIISQVWGYDFIGEATRTIDVHIRQIRKVIGDENEGYIETVRGVGYRMRSS
ncbi:MAG: response regulator transcription factor [Clostridiales bacterium]|jgi:two-component system alkaline phosphatase synthesis response regulator PhoP|nr:response regulator transcription factor [Clostridiales bacterium]